MKENHIIVSKTARYYTLGELTGKTKQVWFILHGFGQNARYILRQVEPLYREDIFFIAPEALNRFYLKGSSGDVGATWMTKEDRVNEIKDYTSYLNNLYDSFEFERFSASVNALGFSQGSSTVTRWINNTNKRIGTLIVYAGEVAPELFPLRPDSGLRKSKNIFVCGTKDEYFNPEIVSKMKEAYREMNFTEIDFDGKHEINCGVLKAFF